MDDRDWSDPVRRNREANPPLAVGWSRDQTAMAIRRIWCLHVSSGKPPDHFTYAQFLSTCSDEDCVDSGPRDRRLCLDLTLTVSPRHLQKVRRVGHSPTREKERDVTRLNRGVDSPNNCRHYLLCYLPYAWRPTRAPTCARVFAWPFATWPRRAPPALHVGCPQPATLP